MSGLATAQAAAGHIQITEVCGFHLQREPLVRGCSFLLFLIKPFAPEIFFQSPICSQNQKVAHNVLIRHLFLTELH